MEEEEEERVWRMEWRSRAAAGELEEEAMATVGDGVVVGRLLR